MEKLAASLSLWDFHELCGVFCRSISMMFEKGDRASALSLVDEMSSLAKTDEDIINMSIPLNSVAVRWNEPSLLKPAPWMSEEDIKTALSNSPECIPCLFELGVLAQDRVFENQDYSVSLVAHVSSDKKADPRSLMMLKLCGCDLNGLQGDMQFSAMELALLNENKKGAEMLLELGFDGRLKSEIPVMNGADFALSYLGYLALKNGWKDLAFDMLPSSKDELQECLAVHRKLLARGDEDSGPFCSFLEEVMLSPSQDRSVVKKGRGM